MSDLPTRWRAVRVDEIGDVRLGRQRSPARATGPYMRPYMRAANVGWDGLRLDDVKEMDFDPKEFETYRLRDGDILVGEASGSRDEVGKSAVWRGQVPGACFQNTLIRVRVRDDDPDYVQQHLKFDALRGALADVSRGVGIHHLGREGLANWTIGLPPREEQRRIVEKIEALTAKSRRAKEALDAIPPLLERFRQSVLAAAFRGDLTKDWREQNPDVETADQLLARIRQERRARWEQAELENLRAKGKAPKNDEWKDKYPGPESVDLDQLPDLPHGWCWASAAEACAAVVDCHNKTAPYTSSGIPLLRTSNIRGGQLLLDDLKYVTEETYAYWSRRCPPKPGDVLFTREAPMGEAALIPAGFRVCMGQRMMLLSADPRLLDSGYLCAAVQTPEVRRYAARVAVGTGVKHLRVRDVEALPIALAPRAEQNVIAARLSSAAARIGALRTAFDDARTQSRVLDSSILAKAFRGELVESANGESQAGTAS